MTDYFCILLQYPLTGSHSHYSSVPSKQQLTTLKCDVDFFLLFFFETLIQVEYYYFVTASSIDILHVSVFQRTQCHDALLQVHM